MPRAFWGRRGRESRETPPEDDLHLAEFDADAALEDEAIEHTHLREDGRFMADRIEADVEDIFDRIVAEGSQDHEDSGDDEDYDDDEFAGYEGEAALESPDPAARRAVAQHPAGSAAVDPEDTLRALRDIYDRVRRDAREGASRHKDWDAAIRRAAAQEAEELLANSVLSPGAIREAIRRIELRRTSS